MQTPQRTNSAVKSLNRYPSAYLNFSILDATTKPKQFQPTNIPFDGRGIAFLILTTKRKYNYGNNNSRLLQGTAFTELH